MKNKKIVLKNGVLKTKSQFAKLIVSIGKIDVDFMFIYLGVFIFLNASWYQEILFSIGVAYFYKKVVKDIINIKRIKWN